MRNVVDRSDAAVRGALALSIRGSRGGRTAAAASAAHQLPPRRSHSGSLSEIQISGEADRERASGLHLHRPPVGLLRSNASRSRSSHEGTRPAIVVQIRRRQRVRRTICCVRFSPAAAAATAFRISVRDPNLGGGGPRTGIRAATLHRPPVGLLRSNANRSRSSHEGTRRATIVQIRGRQRVWRCTICCVRCSPAAAAAVAFRISVRDLQPRICC